MRTRVKENSVQHADDDCASGKRQLNQGDGPRLQGLTRNSDDPGNGSITFLKREQTEWSEFHMS